MKKRLSYLKLIIVLLLSVIVLILSASCGLLSEKSENETDKSITITDMTNRQVTIPVNIKRIYAADPGSTILVYTVSPEKLLGWSYMFNDVEAAFIAPDYKDLQVFGMGAQVNYEVVISEEPDIAILSSTAGGSSIETADNLEEKLGIPVVVVDLELLSAPETYLLMGKVIGDEARGQELSNYAQSVLDSIIKIPDNERVSIYYANGAESLNTSARGTAASQLFDILYVQNVCEMKSETGDRIQITKEHLLTWNPDFIFVNGEPKEDISGISAATNIINNTEYAELKAVKNINVISIPKAPFAWLDRPRSVNRLIGIKWLGSIVYPEYYSFENNDIKDFYKLFYHIDLTDEQIQQLLNQ